MADVWLEMDFDEIEGVEDMVDRLWTDLKPLYEQLQAFVRGRLSKFYDDTSFPPDGTIPAHLLGG